MNDAPVVRLRPGWRLVEPSASTWSLLVKDSDWSLVWCSTDAANRRRLARASRYNCPPTYCVASSCAYFSSDLESSRQLTPSSPGPRRLTSADERSAIAELSLLDGCSRVLATVPPGFGVAWLLAVDRGSGRVVAHLQGEHPHVSVLDLTGPKGLELQQLEPQLWYPLIYVPTRSSVIYTSRACDELVEIGLDGRRVGAVRPNKQYSFVWGTALDLRQEWLFFSLREQVGWFLHERLDEVCWVPAAEE